MADYYIYIDDSGDPGMKAASSKYFIIAAVVVVGLEAREELENAINGLRLGLGWREDEELKFNKTNRKYVRAAIKATACFDYEAYAMVLNKQRTTSVLPEQSMVFLYVIKELLRKIAPSGAVVVIDGAYGSKYITKARTYLRQQLKASGIKNIAIHFVDSRKSALVQLADLVAGSVARSLSRVEKDQEFVKLFGKKLKEIYEL